MSESTSPSSSMSWRSVIGVAAVLIVASTVATFTYVVGSRQTPEALLESARQLEATEPLVSLQLLDQAIAARNGEFPSAQILKCQILGTTRSWRSAERYYDKILAVDACNQRELLQLAAKAHQSNEPWFAAKVLDVANRSGELQEVAVRRLMTIRYELGERAAVLRHCEQLSQLVPSNPEPWLVSASMHHEVEQFSAALNAYKHGIQRLSPGKESQRVRFQVAELSIHLGDIETADKYVVELKAEGLREPDLLLLEAKLLRRSGNNEAAQRLVNAILGKHPRMFKALLLRSILAFDEGDYEAAVTDLSIASMINPYDHNARYKLGQTLQRLGRTNEATEQFEVSRRLTHAISQILSLGRKLDEEPKNRDIRLQLAEQHAILGDSETAAHWRRTAMSIN